MCFWLSKVVSCCFVKINSILLTFYVLGFSFRMLAVILVSEEKIPNAMVCAMFSWTDGRKVS